VTDVARHNRNRTTLLDVSLGDPKNRRFLVGQVATETLLVIGFLFLFLVPLLIYVFSILSADSWKMDAEQSRATVVRIVNIANKISLGGEGTSAAETVFLPQSVSELKSNGTALIIRINTRDFGIIDEVAMADVPIILDPTKDWTDVKGTSMLYLNITGGNVWLSKS